jgi:hypothetical protein
MASCTILLLLCSKWWWYALNDWSDQAAATFTPLLAVPDSCQALILEDVVKSRQVGEYEPPPSFAAPAGSTPLRVQLTKALWQYRCTAHPVVRKVVAAVLVGMSLGVIWCEATIFTARKPDLSPFSLLIRWVMVLGCRSFWYLGYCMKRHVHSRALSASIARTPDTLWVDACPVAWPV